MFPIGDINPTRIKPIVNYSIIGLCVAVFLLQLLIGLDVSAFEFGAIPARIFSNRHISFAHGIHPAPAWLTMFTHMFMHGGLMHIGGNMLFLYVFGDNIEDAMGHVRYALFYIICGLGAAVGHGLTAASSAVPMVGASGAISGVLAAYMVLYPRARVRTVLILFYFIRIVYLPALVLLGFWFVYQLILGMTALGGTEKGGGVAYFAHVGGFILGILLVKIFTLGRDVQKAPQFPDRDNWY